MTVPPKWRDQPCPACGTPRRVVNPAWLRAQRVGAKLTLRDVAALVDFSPIYLSDIERGNRACPVRVREAYEQLS